MLKLCIDEPTAVPPGQEHALRQLRSDVGSPFSGRRPASIRFRQVRAEVRLAKSALVPRKRLAQRLRLPGSTIRRNRSTRRRAAAVMLARALSRRHLRAPGQPGRKAAATPATFTSSTAKSARRATTPYDMDFDAARVSRLGDGVAGGQVWYVDGKVVNTYKGPTHEEDVHPHRPSIPADRQIDPNMTYPRHFEVDHVRVYAASRNRDLETSTFRQSSRLNSNGQGWETLGL